MARKTRHLSLRLVEVAITEGRRAELGLKVAGLTEDLGSLLEQRAAFVLPSREQEKELRGELGAIARALRLGREQVDRLLRPEPDYAIGRMLYFDPETGEELDSRPLLPSERQAEIPT